LIMMTNQWGHLGQYFKQLRGSQQGRGFQEEAINGTKAASKMGCQWFGETAGFGSDLKGEGGGQGDHMAGIQRRHQKTYEEKGLNFHKKQITELV